MKGECGMMNHKLPSKSGIDMLFRMLLAFCSTCVLFAFSRIHRSSFIIHHSPFSRIHRSSFIIHHSPFSRIHPSSFILHPFSSFRRGFSMLEVVVSMAILLAGIAAIATFFPMSVRHNQRAVDVSTAAYVAQMKAEEIRRDDSANHRLVREIRQLTDPTKPVTFPLDSRFAYSFCGRSMIDDATETGGGASGSGIARVIIIYSPEFKPRPDLFSPKENILFELRFYE